MDEKRKINGQWYTWQTALRLVQGYGRSIRSKEDYAVTYVLDSGFQNFVKRNKNILPDWFIKAIQSRLFEEPFGHAAFVNSSKVHTISKENHNTVINNHYNPSIISEQTVKQNLNNTTEKSEIASTASIKMLPGPSRTLVSLDRDIKAQSNRQERLSSLN